MRPAAIYSCADGGDPDLIDDELVALFRRLEGKLAITVKQRPGTVVFVFPTWQAAQEFILAAAAKGIVFTYEEVDN